jgi:phosphoribosylformylglycinamidine synthase
VAFVKGPREQFAQKAQTNLILSSNRIWFGYPLKAETHNFPTTVEPFNGAATGSGGEIRDRLAGGQGSFAYGRNSIHDFILD